MRYALCLVLLAGCTASVGSSSGSSSGSTAASSGSTTGGATSGSSGATGSTGSSGGGDTYLPWEGGPAYYGAWSHAPSTDPSFFPIAVWLQSPSNASAYQAIGINTFIGLWQGPTDAQLATIDSASIDVVCAQDVDWANHLQDPLLVGWQQQDEPDNAQPEDDGGYGPCVDPAVIQQLAAGFRANDPTRPVYLNLGQGVAWADWYGRGSACAGVDNYPQYAQGADILSFDIYPVNSTDAAVEGKLELVAEGVDHLRTASNFQKPVWVWIETTGQSDPSRTPTPAQIRAEVWMALIHGARGVGYFAHIFAPSFIEAGLLSVSTSKQAVSDVDQELQTLAPALNSPSLANGATVASSDPNVPVDLLVKREGGALYVFAAAMRNAPADATFTVRTPTSGTVTVLGESRTLALSGGTFSDHFDGYAVHLYEITP